MPDNPDKNRTILIVDDTVENIELLDAILSPEYTIRTAMRGSEAIEIARTTLPDLILLDIMMPEMNGYDACAALKADDATHNIPVIFVTALLNPGDETRGFEAGGVDYITKPVVGAVVRVRVKAHLALKEAQDAMVEWNQNLKRRLLQSIATIRTKTEALMSAEERASGLRGYAQCVEIISGVFEMMEDRFGISSRAVSELAGDAARNMGLSSEEVAKIRLAALLRNVGTLGTRRSLSEKNESEMAANEQKKYKAHPVVGQELFKALEELQDVGLMVRGHHEAFDGSGFPDGLKGEEIPLGARLIAIADFIEHAAGSVSSERDVFALANVRRHAGTLLDGRLIGYFTMITRILYFDRKKSATTGEVEVLANELMTGMQISRDLANPGGMLLLQKGDILDLASIKLIRRMNRSSDNGIWVYVGDDK